MPGFLIPIDKTSDGCGIAGTAAITYTRGKPQHNIETNRKHRYLWEIFASGSGSTSYSYKQDAFLVYAYKSGRPSPEIDEIVIHSGQDEIYRPGKNRWGPIEVSFYEVLNGQGLNSVSGVADFIYNWWAESMISLRTSSHRRPNEYLRSCLLAMLDGNGNATWRYELRDCWPSKVTPSDLSYADTDIADITVTLRFSKAVERPGS